MMHYGITPNLQYIRVATGRACRHLTFLHYPSRKADISFGTVPDLQYTTSAAVRPASDRGSGDLFAEAVSAARTSTRVRRRHPGRLAGGAVALLIVAYAVYLAAGNEAVEWGVVGDYFTSTDVLRGLFLTLWLTLLVTTAGLVFGTALAAMRLGRNPVLHAISWVYVWFFRSVPLLVQLLFWFNIGYLFPEISLGIPFGETFVSTDARSLISGTAAAIIGMTLHEAAYASEIVRGGLLSVDQGQTEAANALALSRWRTLRRIVLPQAMPAIVPPAGNLLIGTLKATAMVSVIAVNDLLYSVQLIYNENYKVVPLLVVAPLWYALVTSVLSVGQYYV